VMIYRDRVERLLRRVSGALRKERDPDQEN
jgi:hypothetical protein